MATADTTKQYPAPTTPTAANIIEERMIHPEIRELLI